MDFGIGAVTVHDEIPNKSCSVILRELYNIIHASFEWTATSNTIPKIRRDAIALQAEMDRAVFPVVCVFFFFKCLDALSFLFTYFFFFSFTFPFSDYTANALAAASDGSEHQSHPSALSSISVSTTVALCSATSGTSCFAVLLANPLLGR